MGINQKKKKFTIKINPSTKIFIIEGISGSGKTKTQNRLKELLKEKLIYSFPEEELLFSWKHTQLKNISKLRIELMHSMLVHCEKIIKEHPDAVFIFDRFHISFLVLESNHQKEIIDQYTLLIQRLRALPVHIYIPLADEEDMEAHISHHERSEEVWKLHLFEMLLQMGTKNLCEIYKKEQEMIKEIAAKQEIPHTFLIAK